MKVHLFAVAVGLLISENAFAQSPVPQIAFDSVPDAIKMPKDLYLGEASGVAVNSKGHVFVFSRGSTTGPAYAAAAAQLLEFDANGNYLREIGKNLYGWSFAHTVRVDKDDNVWATDKGSDLVIKFSPEGKVLMVLDASRRPVTRTPRRSSTRSRPCRPRTALPPGDRRDVGPGGQHLHQRRLHQLARGQDRQGWQLGQAMGNRGNKPSEFNTPHSIAADAKSNIYVADRFNRRIQVFDGDGKFVRAIKIDAPFDHSDPACDRQHGRPRRQDRHVRARCAVGRVHHASAQSGALCVGRLSWADLQAHTRRQAARHDRQRRQATQAIRMDPRDCVSLREHPVCRRTAELARTETGPSSIEPCRDNLVVSEPNAVGRPTAVAIAFGATDFVGWSPSPLASGSASASGDQPLPWRRRDVPHRTGRPLGDRANLGHALLVE